jgi:hypothetical protein
VDVAVQLNVVAVKLLLKFILVLDPSHIVCVAGVAVTTGNGLIVIVAVTGELEAHPLAEGVIV